MRQALKRYEAPPFNPRNIDQMLAQIAVEESRRACEVSLHEFVKQAWHVIEPGVPFVDGWHIQAICDHLEAVSRGEIMILLINIPPRFAKSTIVSVLWPCWEWTTKPTEQYLCASYSSKLSTRDTVASRRLMASPWYQARWGKKWSFSSDQNEKTKYENSEGGRRIASSVGTGTGEGGSRLILDDPHNADEAQSDVVRESDIEWLGSTWIMRRNDPKTTAMVTVMQRLHTEDASAWMLKQGAEHLCLPMEWDGIKRKTSLGVYDKRTKRGELLWPERFPAAIVKQVKTALGAYGASGQLQQQPAPAGGGILKSKYIRLWPHDEPLPIPRMIFQSYDTGQSGDTKPSEKKTDTDPTACGVYMLFDRIWKTKSGEQKITSSLLIIDAWDEKLEYPDLLKRVNRDWRAKYGGSKEVAPRRADLMLLEKKSSGIALCQELIKDGNCKVQPIDPGNLSKEARARLVSPLVEAGLVWVLESKVNEDEAATWAKPMLTQMDLFPKAPHDDHVDQLVQVLSYCHRMGYIEIPRADYHEEDWEPNRYQDKKPMENYYYA